MAAFADRALVKWYATLAVMIAAILLQPHLDWLGGFPDALVLPVSAAFNAAMDWFVGVFGELFRALSVLFSWPIDAVRATLHWLPWPVVVLLVGLVAHAAGGWRLALFAVAALGYMLVVGYWSESMNTLSLVAISVPLATLIGFAVGVLGFLSARAERAIMPTLDLLQTIPAFAYLIPVLLLFGFGAVVGLIASLLFAFPPMVRNTIVGLRNVPVEVVEAGTMAGATPWQLFWLVRVPVALRQILLGVNQTTMAALSMVIVASIVGGTDDIGWEVLRTMRKAQFGESLLAGLVIALIAMVMDRVTWGLATRDSEPGTEESALRRHRHLLIALVGGLALYGLAALVPALADYPRAWTYSPAGLLNDGIDYLITNYRASIETIKNFAFFFLMLPVRIGLQQAVSPFTWGFEPTLLHKLVYAAAVVALSGYSVWRGRKGLGVTLAIGGLLLYFGLVGLPWVALVALFLVMAFAVGGAALAGWTAAGLAFLLLSGLWDKAVLSLYLCGIAAAIAFVLGTALGIWASMSDRVSATLRPINDTLQTMPLFVLLIPAVMVFKIGEFTALLAIVAYAFVPAVRYAEHGLRNLPGDVVEAATAIGCTKWQLLREVKLPLALPSIALGLNQTILYAITMLVIAALVGTNGLGQQVYIGLGDGDFGVGMAAGIGMAIIAMLADRITQAWRRRLASGGGAG